MKPKPHYKLYVTKKMKINKKSGAKSFQDDLAPPLNAVYLIQAPLAPKRYVPIFVL